MLRLSDHDEATLAGAEGPANALALRLITDLARATRAERLRDITGCHIDGCMYHGAAGVDFATKLADLDARVAVPTTLNTSSLDLIHPGIMRSSDSFNAAARTLMDAYVRMGCRPTWTCTPYQLPGRPDRGAHVAWGESNAIVFANAVLGARTERYADLIDICAGITGRVPDVGLHLDHNRRGEVIFDVSAFDETLRRATVFFPVLGYLVGRATGAEIPVIDGLDVATSEDQLKAFGAAAAASGKVAMFHAVGVTPEAPDLDAALQGTRPSRLVEVTPADVRAARDQLGSAAPGATIDAVSVGTPHLSVRELVQLADELHRSGSTLTVPFYVSTSRFALAAARDRGVVEVIEAAGAQLVVDTCTYVTRILPPELTSVMTNSGKWAYYAAANLGVQPIFGSLGECVRSAATGVLQRDSDLWGDR